MKMNKKNMSKKLIQGNAFKYTILSRKCLDYPKKSKQSLKHSIFIGITIITAVTQQLLLNVLC